MLLNTVEGTEVPAHCTIGVIAVTVGLGFIVIVNVIGVPLQPLKIGVTVMVAEIAVLPALVAVNDGKFPEPLAPKPMAVLELVHV